MPTPPTLVSAVQVSSWSTTTATKTITGIPVQSGDLLVVDARTYDNAGSSQFPNAPVATVTSGGASFPLIWTKRQEIAVSGHTSAAVWTAPVPTTSAGITLSLTYGASTHQWGFVAEVWRDHGGVGVSNKANGTGAPSLTLTGVSADSAIHLGNSDWNFVAGARTYRTGDAGAFTEAVYATAPEFVGSFGRHSSAGAAGSKTVGLTAPTGQKFSTIAVEVLGVAVAAHDAAASFVGAGAISVTGQATRQVTAAFAGAGAMTAATQQTHQAAVSVAGAGAMTVGSSVDRPGAASFAGSGQMTAAGTRIHAAAASFTGSGALVATPGGLAQATFAGAGELTAQTRQTHQAVASLAGDGQLTSTVFADQQAAATFAGAGQMLADARPVRPATATFAGAGELTADGRRVHPANWTAAGAGALFADGTRIRPASAVFAGSGRMQVSARLDKPGVNLSLWAVLPSNVLAPLPAFETLELSRERNGVGSVRVDYPAAGAGFGYLRAAVVEDRPVEVEMWLGGSRTHPLRARLTQTSGDDLDGRAVWSFTGGFAEADLADGVVYPQPAPAERGELRFDAKNPGQVVLTVLQQAQARGALTGMGRDWTTSLDSSGQAWPSTISGLKYSPKTTLLAILQDLVDKDFCEFEVVIDDNGAKVLRLWAPDRRGTDRTTGAEPTLFRYGRISASPLRHSTRDTVTAILAIGADGLSATASDATAEARIGRRIEGSVDAGNIDNQAALTAYAQAALSALTKGQEEIRHPLTFGPGDPRPLAGYDLADRVLSERAGGARRGVDVQQWTLTANRQRVTDGEVVLNDLIASRLQRLARQVDRLTSGGAVIGTSEPPADDTLAPAAPSGVTADSSAYQEGGDTVAVLHVAWAPVDTNSDGSATDDVAGYRVEYAYSAEPAAWTLGADVSGTTASFGSLTAGVDVLVRVRAYDRNGNVSAPSSVVELTTEVDNIAPPVPSAPIVTTRVSILAAEWDGLGSSGEAMPLDLDFVEVHVSAASNFTPDASTYYDQLGPGGGVMPITGRPYGAVTFVRLVAVDKTTPTPNRSDPSVQGSGTPQPVVSADIFDGAVGSAQLADLAVTNAKIDLLAVNAANIGSVNAGTIVSGTVSALLTLSGIIRTDVSPNRRMEITSNGWSAYNASNQLWAELNLATLSMLVTGTYQSGVAGERINILQDGTMRFYGSSGTSYAEIANNGSNLFFRARASSLTANQGYLYLEPARVYIGYGQPGSLAESHLAAQNDNIEIRSPIIGFRVERRFGNPLDGTRPRAVFLHMDNAGTTIASSVLEYSVTGVGAGEAWFQATGQNSGIIFASNNVFISHNDGNPAELRCGNLVELSARRFKDRVRDIAWTRADGATVTALDVVVGARSREWEYTHDRVRPARPGLLLSKPRLGEDGRPLLDSTGAEIRDDVQAEWGFPLPDPPKRYGPMADDLKALAPSLVRSDPDHPDREWVSVSDKVGVLWEAVAQLAEQVRRRPGGLL